MRLRLIRRPVLVLSIIMGGALAPVRFSATEPGAATAECTTCCPEAGAKCVVCSTGCILAKDDAYDNGGGKCQQQT